MLTVGEAVYVGVQGVYGKSLSLPLNFAVNLQFKNQVFKKIKTNKKIRGLLLIFIFCS